MVDKQSFITGNIEDILKAQKTWRGNLDIFKAFDETNNVKFLLKEVTSPQKDEEQQTEQRILMAFIRSEDTQKYLPICEGTVNHDERQFVVFRKQGKSLNQWLRQQQQALPFDQRRLSKFLLQFVEIAEILNSQSIANFYLADQIPAAFSILENDQVQMLPLRISSREFKDHVYSEYVKSLTEEETIFFYPPEILQEALTCEINPTFIERGEKLDIWVIGIILSSLLEESKEEKDKLSSQEDLNDSPQYDEVESLSFYKLFLRMLEKDPAMRISMKELKEWLMKINNCILAQEDNPLNAVGHEETQGTMKDNCQNYSIQQESNSLRSYGENESADELTLSQYFGTNSKWSSCVLQLLSIEETKLSASDKSQLFLTIKQCLNYIMNQLFSETNYNKNDNTGPDIIATTSDQGRIDTELTMKHKRVLANPTGIQLIDFFLSAEQLAQQSEQHFELQIFLNLALKQILKALVSSRNWQKAISFSEHFLAFKSNDIEAMLMCAQCYLNSKSNEALNYADSVLQIEPKNPSALFFKAKFYKSVEHDSVSAVKYFNECLLEVSKNDKPSSLLSNIPYYPVNYKVHYELGKLHWKLSNFKESMENFKACLDILIQPKGHNKMKVDALKAILLWYLNEMDNKSIQNIKKAQSTFTSSSRDPDLCALLSESVLVSHYHPQLAMHFVEQGLQARLFNEDESLDENSKIQVIPQNFWCLIQQAKINFKIGRNPRDIIVFLLKLKQEMEKDSRYQCQEEETNDSLKLIEKKRFEIVIDWNHYLDMLLVEIYIETDNIEKAEEILSADSLKSVKFNEKRSQCERAYWQAVIFIKRGRNNSAVALLDENRTYPPSLYQLSIAYLRENQLQNAIGALRRATLLSPQNTQYLQALANLYWDNAFEPLYLFNSYMIEIMKENLTLQQLHKRRRRLPERTITFDSLSITRLGKCLVKADQPKLALVMFKLSLRINHTEYEALLCCSEILFQEKSYAEAKNYLLQIQEKDANTDDYYFFLGMSQIHTGDYSIGKELLKKIGNLTKFKQYYDRIKLLAEARVRIQEIEEALFWYNEYINIQDKDSQALSAIGHCYLEIKDYQNAKVYFLKSLAITKDNDSLFQSLLDVYEILKEPPDIKIIAKLESNFVENKKILNYLGQVYFDAVSTDSSFIAASVKYFELSKPLPEEDPTWEDFKYQQIAFLRLAQLSFMQREYPISLHLMQFFVSYHLSENPTEEDTQLKTTLEYEALFFSAQLYLYLGKDKLFCKYLLKCIQITPETGQLYLIFARYLLSKQSQAAWKYFAKGMTFLQDQKDNEEQEDILFLKSVQAIQNGQTEEAKSLLTKCAKLHKKSEKCLFLLGNLHLQDKQYEQAILFFQNCIDMSSACLFSLETLILTQEELIDCYISLGRAHFKINQLKEAISIMKQCLDLFPLNSKVRANFSYLQFKEGSISEANHTASDLIQAGSCDIKTYYILAVTSMRVGNILQAIQALEGCNKLQPNYKQVQLKLGLIYASIGRPKQALQYYLQHLSYSPKSAQGLIRSSKLLGYFKYFSLAQSHLDRLFAEIKQNNKSNPQSDKDESTIDKSSSSEESVIENEQNLDDKYVRLDDAYAVQGYLWSQQNNLSEALLSYEKAVKLNPHSKTVQYSLAFVHSQLHNYKQEIKVYKKLLKQEQSTHNQLNIILNLGVAYKKAGKIQKSIQTYEKAVIDTSDECSMNLLANLSAVLLESKEHSKAISFLTQALENDRNHTESLFLLGIAYQDKGDLSEASNFLEKSIKSNLYFFPPYLSLSLLKCNLGKLSEAISVSQYALVNCPEKERILLFLGNIYLKSNDFWAALATFESILAITDSKGEQNQSKPNKFTIQSNLQIARVYRKLHGDEKAIDHLKNHCLNSSPDQPEYLHGLGSILIHHESRQIEALEMLKQAVNACPDNAVYNFSLADALHCLHQYELEIDSLKKCLELKSDFKLKFYNNLAIAYQLTHNRKKALDTFKIAIQKFPDVASLYFNLGNYYQSSRKLIQAVESYRTCILKDPSLLGALHNLAVVSVQLRDFQSAINYFSRCLQLHPEQRQIYQPKIAFLLQNGYSPQAI